MNLVEKARATAEMYKFETSGSFGHTIKELCQAVVEAEETLRFKINQCGNLKCKSCKSAINDWISRYAGEEKKDE